MLALSISGGIPILCATGRQTASNILFEFISTPESELSEVRIIDFLTDAVDAAGFDFFTLSRQPRPDTSGDMVMAGRWPEGWPEHYVRRRFSNIDPLMRYLGHCQVAFRWGDALEAFLQEPQRRRMERMMADARRFGLEDGYVFPVHGRRGLMGALIAGGSLNALSEVDRALFDQAAKKAFWLLSAKHDPAAHNEIVVPVNVKLTSREADTLACLAKGMTSNDIGEALGISSNTADWYINGMQSKLGARNRHHAVAIAFRLGLIS